VDRGGQIAPERKKAISPTKKKNKRWLLIVRVLERRKKPTRKERVKTMRKRGGSEMGGGGKKKGPHIFTKKALVHQPEFHEGGEKRGTEKAKGVPRQ